MKYIDRFKFRIWDKENKCMHYPTKYSNFNIVNGVIVKIESYLTVNGVYSGKGVAYEFDDAVLMQCTGRKDDTGKLMYEKDIVETWKFSTGETSLRVISWNEARCGFRLYTIDHFNRGITDSPQSMVNVTTMKIVGNIYENHKLLEGDECENEIYN